VWEEEIVAFLRERKSYRIAGIPGGFETGIPQPDPDLTSGIAADVARSGTDITSQTVILDREVDVETNVVHPQDSPMSKSEIDKLLNRFRRRAPEHDVVSPVTPTGTSSMQGGQSSTSTIYHDALESTEQPSTSRNTGRSASESAATPVRPANILGTDEELFSRTSVAGRKRELDSAHLSYFKASTEQLMETTKKLKLEQEVTELARKKLKFEVSNLEIDRRIKLLKERHLELLIFKQEVELSGSVLF
jgi:hypothetical protein